MINKKNHLGRKPEKLGIRDAIHTAIVALRAGCFLRRADYIKINTDGEAVCSSMKDSVGVVNPFLKESCLRAGDWFWAVMNMEDIPNVVHYWEHPNHTFESPKCEVKKNATLKEYADTLQVSYEQLMSALDSFVEDERQVAYPGTLTEDELDSAYDKISKYEMWTEWESESDYEFENCGTSCCPEYEHPSVRIFKFGV